MDPRPMAPAWRYIVRLLRRSPLSFHLLQHGHFLVPHLARSPIGHLPLPRACALSAAQPAALRRPPAAPGPVHLIHVTTSSHAPPPSPPLPRPSSPSPPPLPLPRPSGATTSRGGACRGQARTVAGVAVRHRGRAASKIPWLLQCLVKLLRGVVRCYKCCD